MPRALKIAYKKPLLAPRKSSSSQQVSQPKSPSIKQIGTICDFTYQTNPSPTEQQITFQDPFPHPHSTSPITPYNPKLLSFPPRPRKTPSTMDSSSKQPAKPTKSFEPTFTGFRGLTPEQEDEARVRAASTHWRAKVEDKKAQKSSSGASSAGAGR
ncbi:hypothetical protein G7Y79_00007g022160 [Physcia stellaris]|nr:hypothetical protein G7Y79_00007g022160 [Physcia stellaris]